MTDHKFTYDYIREPELIYKKSFWTVAEEVDLSSVPADLGRIITRIIHSCGMPEIFPDIAASNGVEVALKTALNAGAPILCDCEMVRRGIIARLLPAENKLICTLNDPSVPSLATSIGTTRSAAAIELWRPFMDGAIAVFGNAPTALFHLLEMIEQGGPKPAAIIGFPVGFVGAAESKQALSEAKIDVPFITLMGRKGGSAMAAAALNGASVIAKGADQ